MRLRLPKTRRYRIYLYLLSAAIILLTLDLLLVRIGRHITIGPDTTRITTPLRPDGTPDYAQAIDDLAATGVTVDSNSAIPLIRILGPKFLPPDRFAFAYARLGLSPQDAAPDTFIAFEDWYQKPTPASPLPDVTANTLKRPWKASDHPDVAAWLAANAPALDAFRDATRRPRYFIPIAGQGPDRPLLASHIPNSNLLSSIGNAAIMRAMQRLDAGDLDGAAEDLAAVHRMAALLSAGSPALIGNLVAIALDAKASAADAACAFSSTRTADDARRRLAAFDTLPPLAGMDRVIDACVRYSTLDLVCAGSRHGNPWMMSVIHSNTVNYAEPPLTWPYLFVPIRYNPALRTTNRLYDHLVAAARASSFRDASALNDAMADQIRALAQETKLRQTISGDRFPVVLVPALSRIFEADHAARQRRDLARLAFALASFHADHHAYPPSLVDLLPAYLPALPNDRFTDAPLHYRTTPDGYILYSLGPNMIDNGGLEHGQGRDTDDLTVSTTPPPTTRPR